MNTKNESRIESKNESKIDNLKQNSVNGQLKDVVKDEIPLIDSLEDEIVKSDHLTSSINNELTLKQTRSTNDAILNEQNNQNINQDNQIDGTVYSSLASDHKLKQTNLSIHSSNTDQQTSVGGQSLDQCQLQMMNNFEKIQLNEDVSLDRCFVNDEDTQATDLCQFDSVDPDSVNPDEQEEKERLIQQLLELRNTLDDLSNRVSSVREMSFKLTNENNVLSQYVENLMSASSVFVTTNAPTIKRKHRK